MEEIKFTILYGVFSNPGQQLRPWSRDMLQCRVQYLFHDLGGHPAGGAHEGVPGLGPGEVASRRQPCRHAEVRNLDLAVCAQEDVAGLD